MARRPSDDRAARRAERRSGGSAVVEQPKPPFPEQHIDKPGLESELRPRPRFEAPAYKAAGKLQGLAALVTGGDSGIGRAVAVLFAREGADVAITHLPQERTDAETTRRAVEAEGRGCLLLEGDLTRPEFCREIVERTRGTFGRLDVLVNNAAYQQSRERPEDVSDEQWRHTFATNVDACFRVTKAALPHLGRGSSIINTSSITGIRGSEQLLDYAASKGAILAFTKSLARNLLPRGIRVNCVAPGPVWTPLNPADKPKEKVAHFGERAPIGRPAQPEEIAPAYVYFASEADSSYVTGEVLAPLGGETIGG
jgi:NAD(P)-dependent dehydrogenase (short-subunit alcohol dehydrogenase family)